MNTDVYPISTFNEDDRSLQGWTYAPEWMHQNNATASWTDRSPDAVSYVRALFGFTLSLIIYFCILFYLCDNYGDASKKDVDRSIVKKKVLAHGQSQLFGEGRDDDLVDDEEKSTNYWCCARYIPPQCCCKRREKQSSIIVPAPAETAQDILDIYRSRSNRLHQCAHCSSSMISSNNETEVGQMETIDLGDDELVLAEEGSIMNDENVCPICIEPFRIGEEVAWSKIGHCQHVYHYECILPWAVLGNELCPVCREEFWNRDWPSCLAQRSRRRLSLQMGQRRFCVLHGLVSPSEVVANN